MGDAVRYIVIAIMIFLGIGATADFVFSLWFKRKMNFYSEIAAQAAKAFEDLAKKKRDENNE